MAAAGGTGKAAGVSDDESTIKVAPKKETKEKPNGTIKLKRPPPKHNKPGNWRDGSVIDDDKKTTKGTDTPSTNSVGSPGPVVNQLDDISRESFATGRPLEDSPEIQVCKHCKKSVLKTAMKAHIIGCVKAKREKAQRKKEQKEAREREKKEQGEENKKEDDGDKAEDDDDADDDGSAEKKGPGGLKSAKKSAGKKVEIDDATKKGKKRKADGDAEKGPKQKKKKEEPKPKAPKPKGTPSIVENLSTLRPSVTPTSARSRAETPFKRRSLVPLGVPVDPFATTTTPQICSPSSDVELPGHLSSHLKKISSPLGYSLSAHSKNSSGRSECSPSSTLANTQGKGPVDVERQCGVMKDGVPCARSLTCKSHSMGAKRAVAGRSLPYDMLLTAYQKKNQAKQQKAAIDANAPLEDEEAANGPVDSDEELTSVMHGLSNWNPQPLVTPLVQMPIERQYLRQRLYEQLHNATNGFTVNIFKVVGYGSQRLIPGHPGLMDGEGDADGEADFSAGVTGGAGTQAIGNGIVGIAARRASGFTMQLPPQRKTSGSSQR